MTKKSAWTLTQLSLENAEQWLEDAKMLIGKGSYGHANALLRFSLEELAKAWVCWQVSKEIMPENSKPYRDVFKYHIMKTQVILAFIRPPVVRAEEATDEEIIKWWDKVKALPELMEEYRKSCIYVGRANKEGQIHSPKEVRKEETEGLQSRTENLLKFVMSLVISSHPEYEKRLKDAYASLPKDAWKTGEIPREHLGRLTKVLSHD